MSSNAIKIAAVVLVILALILVFIAWRYGQSLQMHAQQAQQSQQHQKNEKPKTMAVIATQALPAHQKITDKEVALMAVPVAPVGYLTQVDQAVGRVPLQDIDAGTPLTQRLFTANNPLAHSIPAGTQALALRIDDVIGSGGFVKPGDHVDVLLYLREQKAGVNQRYTVQTQARVLLKDALVLAYQDLVVPPPADMKKGKDGQQAKPKHEHTAVLAVPDADTTRVMLGASLGTLRLALLPQMTPVAASSSMAPATTASVAAPVTVAPVQVAQATPASNAASTQSAGAADAEPPKDKVITLQELGFIQAKQLKKAQAARGYRPHRAPPKVWIYRGDKPAVGVRP